MNKKVFVTRNIPGPGIDMLKKKGYDVTVSTKKGMLSQKELIKALKGKGYTAVLSLLTDKIDAATFNAAPEAKIFANFAVGYNNIDLAEAAKRGITVTNTPGTPQTMSESVAEHTFALIFALTSRIVEADSFTRKGKYKGWDPSLFLGSEVARKTIGIVGGGGIGERVAHQAYHGFDMNVIYYDIRPNQNLEQDCKATRCNTLEELLKQSDIVSLHVPLLESTRHLINADRLKMMKKSAYLINTARGPVVDEKALVKALKAGTIAGAGIDVFEFEPKLAPGLAKLPNVVLTPHIASATVTSRDEMSRLAAENIISHFEGKTPANVVKMA